MMTHKNNDTVAWWPGGMQGGMGVLDLYALQLKNIWQKFWGPRLGGFILRKKLRQVLYNKHKPAILFYNTEEEFTVWEIIWFIRDLLQNSYWLLLWNMI